MLIVINGLSFGFRWRGVARPARFGQSVSITFGGLQVAKIDVGKLAVDKGTRYPPPYDEPCKLRENTCWDWRPV